LTAYAAYVARRCALAVLVVAGVVIMTFVIAHAIPGDPAATWARPRRRPWSWSSWRW
jgi:peptide/nickel transport system permease protein